MAPGAVFILFRKQEERLEAKSRLPKQKFVWFVDSGPIFPE
jgi:hypothetical protein